MSRIAKKAYSCIVAYHYLTEVHFLILALKSNSIWMIINRNVVVCFFTQAFPPKSSIQLGIKVVQSRSSHLLFWSSFCHCLMSSVIVCHCTVYHTLFICCTMHPLCTCTLQCCCAFAITGHLWLITSCWLAVSSVNGESQNDLSQVNSQSNTCTFSIPGTICFNFWHIWMTHAIMKKLWRTPAAQW